MSKLGDMLDRKVSVEISVSQLVTLRDAIYRYHNPNLDERLTEDAEIERLQILKTIDNKLDSERHWS